MGKTKPNFKHILIISSVTKRYEGLRGVLQKYLQELEFSLLNPVADALPDNQFDWSNIDLMMVDLSSYKSPIYNWYSSPENSAYLPPAIFMAHPASINDAGHFYRAGAADYLDMRGLKNTQLIRSLHTTSSMLGKYKTQPENNQHDAQDTGDKPFSLKTVEKIQSSPTTNPGNSGNKETRAEFLNTGVMSILDREAIKKMSGDDPA